VEITFHELPGASASATAVQVVGSVLVDGRTIRTTVDDDQGAYRLSPAPTNAAPVVGAVVLTSARPTSGAGASVGSDEATPAATEESVVGAPPVTRGAENETVAIQEQSDEVTLLDVATLMTWVEGSPSPPAPHSSVNLSTAPSGASVNRIIAVLASPPVEQAPLGGDLWDWPASEQSSGQAPPTDGLQAPPIVEASSDRAESARAASDLSGGAASRDAAFSSTPALGVRSRTATSTLDEFFASWGGGIETLED
jgi:hypothetical protein